MSKSLAKRFISLFFALYLPMAWIGVPMHKHYCEGKLAGVQVFFEAESCHDEGDDGILDSCCAGTEGTCHSKSESTPDAKDDCCQNEMEYVHLDTPLFSAKKSGNEYPVEAPFIVEFSNQPEFLSLDPVFGEKGLLIPPPLFPDVQSRLSFLGQFLC